MESVIIARALCASAEAHCVILELRYRVGVATTVFSEKIDRKFI